MFDRNTCVDGCLDNPCSGKLYIRVLVNALVHGSVGKRVHHGWMLFGTRNFWNGIIGAMGMNH
jgi:hypothetical protein